MLFASIVIDLGTAPEQPPDPRQLGRCGGPRRRHEDARRRLQTSASPPPSTAARSTAPRWRRHHPHRQRDAAQLPGDQQLATTRSPIAASSASTTRAPPQPYISRDIPTVCNPRNALGHTAGRLRLPGRRRHPLQHLRPDLGDKCNVVVVSGVDDDELRVRPGRRHQPGLVRHGHVGGVQRPVRPAAQRAGRPRGPDRPHRQHVGCRRHGDARRRARDPRRLRPGAPARRPGLPRPELHLDDVQRLRRSVGRGDRHAAGHAGGARHRHRHRLGPDEHRLDRWRDHAHDQQADRAPRPASSWLPGSPWPVAPTRRHAARRLDAHPADEQRDRPQRGLRTTRSPAARSRRRTCSPSRRATKATGGIVRYTGINTASPIDLSSTNNSGATSNTSVIAQHDHHDRPAGRGPGLLRDDGPHDLHGARRHDRGVRPSRTARAPLPGPTHRGRGGHAGDDRRDRQQDGHGRGRRPVGRPADRDQACGRRHVRHELSRRPGQVDPDRLHRHGRRDRPRSPTTRRIRTGPAPCTTARTSGRRSTASTTLAAPAPT